MTLPSDISGLVLWLRAGREQYQDTAGTTPADDAADVVKLWKDASGEGNDFLYASSACALRLAEYGGLPAVQGSGSNSTGKLIGPTPIIGSGDRTIFLLVKIPTGEAVNAKAIADFGWQDGPASGEDYYISAASDVFFEDGRRDYTGVPPVNSYHVQCYWQDGTNTTDVDYYEDGTVKGLSTSTARAINTGASDTDAWLFQRNTSAGGALASTVYIVEVIVFNSALSSTNREAIESYLADLTAASELTADDLATSATALDTPALSTFQVDDDLLANDLALSVVLDAPTLATYQPGDVLLANDVTLSVALDAPTLGTFQVDDVLLANDLTLPATVLDTPALGRIATFYFNDYDSGGEEWPTDPANFVDGSLLTFASTGPNNTQWMTANDCDGSDLGTIQSVNLRLWAAETTNTRYIYLKPVFGGSTYGDDHILTINRNPPAYQFPDVDITDDTNAPGTWSWSDIVNLDCDVVAAGDFGLIYGYRLEIVVAHIPYDENILTADDIALGVVLDAPTLATFQVDDDLLADDLALSVALDVPVLATFQIDDDLTADDIALGVVLDPATLDTFQVDDVLNADDLALSVVLSSPALGIEYILGADDITLSVVLDVPTLATYQPGDVLLANDVTLSVALDAPALGTYQVDDVLLANDITLAVALDTPALGIEYILGADDLALSVVLSSPVLATFQIYDDLTADDLALSVVLDAPVLGTYQPGDVLSADDLALSVVLDPATLDTYQVGDVLNADDLALSVVLSSPALGIEYILGADDITLSVVLDTPQLVDYQPGDELTPDDLALSVVLDTPALTTFLAYDALLADDLALSVVLTEPALVDGVVYDQLLALALITGNALLTSATLDDGTCQPFNLFKIYVDVTIENVNVYVDTLGNELTPVTDVPGAPLEPFTDTAGDELTPITETLDDKLQPYSDEPLNKD